MEGILPGQRTVALFTEKRTIDRSPVDLMISLPVGPEPGNLRADLACTAHVLDVK
jgi:hypothetical protein